MSPHSTTFCNALSHVANALAQLGMGDQVRQVASAVYESGWRGGALARVATALAQVGLLEQARQVAGGIDEPTRRGNAVARIATTFIYRNHASYLAVTFDVLHDAIQFEEIDAQRAFFLEIYVASLSLYPDDLSDVENPVGGEVRLRQPLAG